MGVVGDKIRYPGFGILQVPKRGEGGRGEGGKVLRCCGPVVAGVGRGGCSGPNCAAWGAWQPVSEGDCDCECGEGST